MHNYIFTQTTISIYQFNYTLQLPIPFNIVFLTLTNKKSWVEVLVYQEPANFRCYRQTVSMTIILYSFFTELAVRLIISYRHDM